MKRILCLLSVSALVLLSCGCSSEKNKSSSSSVAPASQSVSSVPQESSQDGQEESSGTGISYQVKDAEKPFPSDSTAKEPLSFGEWGTAAKYCTKDGGYVNVPVRVLSVRRGARVNEEVKRLVQQQGGYYFEPKDNEEYAIAEYEIDLDGFPVAKGGTLCDITAFITGENGEALALEGGGYWGTTASCLDDTTYYYEGVVHGLMAFRIIKNRSDYLIAAGEYGETQAFFKGQ